MEKRQDENFQTTNKHPTGTVTFLFTDIESSTRMWEKHPESMNTALARHDEILRKSIESAGGYVFKTVGDAFCAAFRTAPEALATSVAIQRILQSENWGDTPIRVRMAFHTGNTEERDEDYFGPTLNRVARLLSAGHGGQILLSAATQELVRDQMPNGTSLIDLGQRRLKDLDRPEHVFQLVAPDLPAEFPPLKTLETFPNNLPAQLTSFVGREKEMEEIKRLLNAARLLTLTGPGGTGKTRLSVQTAADMLDAFTDGVWFVELASLTNPEFVPQAAATALGIREEPGQPLMKTLTDWLRHKSPLLILDNCEHVVQAAAQVADAILRGCPNVKILASSREALGIAGETTFQVPSLSLPDVNRLPSFESLTQYEAVRLFIDRAVAVKPDFKVTNENAPTLVRICHRLDGIPLAIELAVARVKTLSLDQIAARLDDRFRLLTGGSRTALPRQQTLRALIDWSYDLLSESERALLRRLSVFQGGWTLESAEAVCSGEGVERPDILDGVSHLVDKSLVKVEERDERARYRMLQTIREYAHEKLRETGESEQIRHRHLDFFLRLAEEIEPTLQSRDQQRGIARLDDEHDNLRSAIEWAHDQGGKSAEFGLRMTVSLHCFWLYRGYSVEGKKWLLGFLSNPSVVTPALRGKALSRAAIFALFHADTRAQSLVEEGLSLCRQSGDTISIALLLAASAWVDMDPILSRIDRAESLLSEALGLFRQSETRWGIALTLLDLGRVARMRDDCKRAVELGKESLAISRELGDIWGIADSLHMLGMWAKDGHDYDGSLVLLEESLALRKQCGYRLGILPSLIVLGDLEMDGRGNFDKADSYFEESLKVARDMGIAIDIAIVLFRLGVVAWRKGDLDRARKLLEESLTLRKEIFWGDEGCYAFYYTCLGDVAVSQTDFNRAESLYRKRAEGLRTQLWDKWGIDATLRGLAVVAGMRGQSDRSGILFGAVERLREIMPIPVPKIWLADFDRNVASVHDRVDQSAFRTGWVKGREMSLEESIEFALDSTVCPN